MKPIIKFALTVECAKRASYESVRVLYNGRLLGHMHLPPGVVASRKRERRGAMLALISTCMTTAAHEEMEALP